MRPLPDDRNLFPLSGVLLTMTKTIRSAFLVVATALVAACAPPPTAEETVAERAQARWNALVTGDFEAAYDFHTPGYRQETTRTEHVVGLSRRKITWIAAKVSSVECEQARCSVETQVTYRADGAPGVLSGIENTRPVREIWVRIDGQWWYADRA